MQTFSSSARRDGGKTANQTVSASEFKAKCREILDRICRREVDQVIVTKRGAAVAVLVHRRRSRRCKPRAFTDSCEARS
jgi:prevent-host-death family protein